MSPLTPESCPKMDLCCRIDNDGSYCFGKQSASLFAVLSRIRLVHHRILALCQEAAIYTIAMLARGPSCLPSRLSSRPVPPGLICVRKE